MVRSFARDSRSRYSNRRPAQTKLKEETAYKWADPPAQAAHGGLRDGEEQEQYRSQAETLDDGVKAHLSKVYGTLAGTIGVAAGGATASMLVPGLMMSPLIPGLGSLVPLFWLYTTNPQKDSETKRGLLLGSFAFLSGMSIAPICYVAMKMNPMLIPTALGATTAMFGAMSVAALAAPPGAALRMGPPLFGGVLVLGGCGLASFFVDPSSALYPVLHSVNLYGGLGIFALYTAFDTQYIIHDYEHGNRDVVQGAVNLFINFKSMFVRILYMFMGSNND